ncbi:hypothetical protein HDU67_003161 [Dinochytrium kinnereticum]|nr:hypothetical protein HDU67_003161 [Dinochytrium kinnereticum]
MPVRCCRRGKASSTVPLTAERHPGIVRGAFASLTEADIHQFRSILSKSGPTAVLTSTDEVSPYNEDWMRKYRGQSSIVLRPKTTTEVSEILRHCSSRRLAVVPQGGNTGLVGGSVPVFDEVILSTSSMNNVEEFDEVSGILTCQAGCILEVLDNWLAERGYMMPLDLGAKGTCQIGGNVATNAGGLRLLRYGSLHGTVLSVEVVMPDGKIVNLGQPLRKDNTGFDLKQLFIGSEGTLGVITKVSILTPRKSSSVNVAVLRLPSYANVQRAFLKAKTDLSEILSAYEFWDSDCSDLVLSKIDGMRPLLSSPPSSPHFYVLLETSGSNESHDAEKVMAFLDGVMEDGIVEDGALAETVTQRSAMWSFRESIPEACARDGEGGNLKYDLSVPVPALYDVVTSLRERFEQIGLGGRFGRVVGFGHMGDGNLHLNVTGTRWNPDVLKAVEPFVYEWVEANRGSISAEHGLGVMKAPYIGYSKSKDAIAMMQQLKSLWDPNGIMNPYKFLPTVPKTTKNGYRRDRVAYTSISRAAAPAGSFTVSGFISKSNSICETALLNPMPSPIIVKIGGSVLTDKSTINTLRQDTINSIASAIKSHVTSHLPPPLILIHGAGSFGHIIARQHNLTSHTKAPPADSPRATPQGVSATRVSVQTLSNHFASALISKNISPVVLTPSALIQLHDGVVQNPERLFQAVQQALDDGLVPLLHGDVVMDDRWGGRVYGGDALLSLLCSHFRPSTALFVCSVSGVLDGAMNVVPEVFFDENGDVVGRGLMVGSAVNDVTGGMAGKVKTCSEVVSGGWVEGNVAIVGVEEFGSVMMGHKLRGGTVFKLGYNR